MQQKNIIKKLHEIQKEVPYLQKGGRNITLRYSYLSESQIAELFKALFEKHGVVFLHSSEIQSIERKEGEHGKLQFLTNIKVLYQFVDVETGEVVGGHAAGQGIDPGDKGIYKAITGAVKYIFMKTFLIPTGDDPEDDSRSAPKGKRVRAAGEEYGSSYGKDEDPTSRPPFGKGSDED